MFKNLNYGIIIPVRMSSTRFPGKPLIKLCGKSMIQRTWERCCEAVGRERVHVATESSVIAAHVRDFGGLAVITSDNCLTGTDRVAEANNQLDLDLVINVQGDEPIINPKDILAIIDFYKDNPGVVVNGMAQIDNEAEYLSKNIPKVAFSKGNRLLYMSRSPLPGNKSGEFESAYKQICIYAFSKMHLQMFSSFNEKTFFEHSEDIEILRFLENDVAVSMVKLSGSSLAVDVPGDVLTVEARIKEYEF